MSLSLPASCAPFPVYLFKKKIVSASLRFLPPCVPHSNALPSVVQHFKSSKSLQWLSTQLLEGGLGAMGITSILWQFGAPGHGKVSNAITP